MIEEWRPIGGYEGVYDVSSLGRVRSRARVVPYVDGRQRRFDERILDLKSSKSLQYVVVSLYRNNTADARYVHRLVADAFLPRVEGKSVVNHIDGVKSNNDVRNLEWCTHSENTRHSVIAGLSQAFKCHNEKITWQDALELRESVWSVIEQWSEQNGVHTQTAWDIISQRNWVKR